MNLAEGIVSEIRRVTEIRELYLALPNGCGLPAAVMMKAALDMAQKCIAEDDILGMLQWYNELKGFTE